MSARGVLQAAVVAALNDALEVAVFDAPPVRAAVPHVLVEEPVLAEWSTKTWTGREARVAVVVTDAGERPVRVRGLLDQVEVRVAALGPVLPDGWRVAGVVLVRSRVVRGGGDRWSATAEFRVRMYR